MTKTSNAAGLGGRQDPTGAGSPDRSRTYDYIIIGSGFGGSISAMRLAEMGYSVLVLERGRRFEDHEFPKTNWDLTKFLWLPALRCFGIFHMTFLNGQLALHGSGVGGGSLGYGNVLEIPDDRLFQAPAWRQLADWKQVLGPHYETARRMLGVTRNPRLWPADLALQEIAASLGKAQTFRPTEVGVFFGDGSDEGAELPDPYFGGAGPARSPCNHCGGCMVGCRYNAKNTLTKNYLYFAERAGAEVVAHATATDIRPLAGRHPGDARYEVVVRDTRRWLPSSGWRVCGRNVILSAGALGTLELLLKCRDVHRTLPRLSKKLGSNVRTNSENILGVTGRGGETDYSQGVAISSIFEADEVTRVEPVRYSEGSSFIRVLAAPHVQGDWPIVLRMLRSLWEIVKHPLDFLYVKLFANWARHTTILLVMQVEENLAKARLGRNVFTLFRRGLVLVRDQDHPIPRQIAVGNRITRSLAAMLNAIPQAAFTDSLFNFPTTAHLMGGVPFGRTEADGVIDLKCEVHNYPGLFVIDGSIMPANPGVNPSLTIAALAEYAMSQVAPANLTGGG